VLVRDACWLNDIALHAPSWPFPATIFFCETDQKLNKNCSAMHMNWISTQSTDQPGSLLCEFVAADFVGVYQRFFA
jgi:hypothetical protein